MKRRNPHEHGPPASDDDRSPPTRLRKLGELFPVRRVVPRSNRTLVVAFAVAAVVVVLAAVGLGPPAADIIKAYANRLQDLKRRTQEHLPHSVRPHSVRPHVCENAHGDPHETCGTAAYYDLAVNLKVPSDNDNYRAQTTSSDSPPTIATVGAGAPPVSTAPIGITRIGKKSATCDSLQEGDKVLCRPQFSGVGAKCPSISFRPKGYCLGLVSELFISLVIIVVHRCVLSPLMYNRHVPRIAITESIQFSHNHSESCGPQAMPRARRAATETNITRAPHSRAPA